MRQLIFRFLADLRVTIFTFLLISLFSILGTLIEQDQSIEIYKMNYPITAKLFGVFSWHTILFFGFDHIFKTWWFYSLIFLFGNSLILCTILQQLPALKIAQRCQFFRTISFFKSLKFSTILTKQNFPKLLKKFKIQNYSFFQQKNLFYAFKGLNGRIAPLIVHSSLLCVLIGALIGSLTGFKSQEIVSKTELFQIENIVNTGQLTYLPNLTTRINDFWITYNKQRIINQFYSDVSILNNQGNEAKRQTIFVNNPLIFNKIYYYQTDWNLTSIRLQNLAKNKIDYPLANILPKNNKLKLWLTWISTESKRNKGFLVLVNNLQGYCSFYNQNRLFLGNCEISEMIPVNFNLRLLEILSSTGLQIKTDPGIVIIYTGFFFLIFSALNSYITYSQIWIFQKPKTIFIGGTTTRAHFEFEFEFLNFIQ